MDETSVVYKLVGPILAKQDVVEATGNVDKRLEFLEKEISRTNTLIKDFEKKMEEKRNSIMKIQENFKKFMQSQQQNQPQMQQQVAN